MANQTPKNIVICCDGTGNEVNAHEQTNVVKLYKCLCKEDVTCQVTYYDPGVGTLGASGLQTSAGKTISKTLGLAFARGMTENIKSAYGFLMHTYVPGDRVYMFGFSRGAYTVRAVAGLVAMCGLLHSDADNLIEYAIKLHRTRKGGQPDWKGAARFRKYFSRKHCPIHFMGLWDTVKSVGLFRRSLVLPYTAMNKHLRHGRHALSINENRSKYRPNLWRYRNSEAFAQVWFAGAHSDVGGGYEEAGLSQIALKWMIDEATQCGLLFDDDEVRGIRPDSSGVVHNPLLPFWWVLGWRQRTIPKGAWVHHTVRDRCASDPAFEKLCQRVLPTDARWI